MTRRRDKEKTHSPKQEKENDPIKSAAAIHCEVG